MSVSYSKTRDELLIIVEDLLFKYRDEWRIPLVAIDQGESYSLFTTSIPINATHLFFRRVPRDYDNPNGIQRALQEKKVEHIHKLISTDNRYSAPNSAVANIFVKERKWGVGIDREYSSNKLSYVTFDLLTIKKRLEEADVDEQGFIKDEDYVTVGFLIDGHHRTEGMYQSGNMNFELPITVYTDLPKEDMPKVFVNINHYQEKPNKMHTLAMRALAGTLSSREEQAHDIMSLLNSESWSLLKGRIKFFEGKRRKGEHKTYINSNTFHKLLVDHILKHIKANLSVVDQSRLINDYFLAWQDVFKIAWEDEKSHVLVKSMGFQIMLRLFYKIHDSAYIENGGKQPGRTAYKKVIEKGVGNGQFLSIGKGENEMKLIIDWKSESFGGYSSGKGINMIVNLLTENITNRI